MRNLFHTAKTTNKSRRIGHQNINSPSVLSETNSGPVNTEQKFSEQSVEDQVKFLLDETQLNNNKEAALKSLLKQKNGLLKLTELERALDQEIDLQSKTKQNLGTRFDHLGSQIDALQKEILESATAIHIDIKGASVQTILTSDPSMRDLFEAEENNAIAITLTRHAEKFGLDSQKFKPKDIAAHKLICLLDDRLNKQKDYRKKSFKKEAVEILNNLDYTVTLKNIEATLQTLNFELVKNPKVRKRVGSVLTVLPNFNIPGEFEQTAKAYADNVFPFFKIDGQKYIFPNVIKNKIDGIITVSEESLPRIIAHSCQLLDAMANGASTIKAGSRKTKEVTARFYDFMYENREVQKEKLPLAEVQAELTMQELLYRYTTFNLKGGKHEDFSITKNNLPDNSEGFAVNKDKWAVDEYARYNLVNKIMFGKKISQSIDKQMSNADNNLGRLLKALSKYSSEPDNYLDDIERAIRPSGMETTSAITKRAKKMGSLFALYKTEVKKIRLIQNDFKNQELSPQGLTAFKAVEKEFFSLIIENMQEIRTAQADTKTASKRVE